MRITADAAYDTVAVYETAGARGATVVIPPARTANVSGHGPRSPARDRRITLVKPVGGELLIGPTIRGDITSCDLGRGR